MSHKDTKNPYRLSKSGDVKLAYSYALTGASRQDVTDLSTFAEDAVANQTVTNACRRVEATMRQLNT